MRGHFSQDIKKAVVSIIKEAMKEGSTQKDACNIIGIDPRKYRRWADPGPKTKRIAWNKILESERDAIKKASWEEELIGKPISHVYVHGHDTDKFHVSLSTVYRVLKSQNMVKPRIHIKRKTSYVSAHEMMKEGHSILCYDGTLFKTETGVSVWAIPVLLLPYRYLLNIGHTVTGVSAKDLTRSVREALALLPEHMTEMTIAHSDRGSAMKAFSTRKMIQDILGAPVHYGRPRTPDDQAWIEALIKTMKFHRDAPEKFMIVYDIVQWLKTFKDIYNNEPHSSLNYVTPLQAFMGRKEEILSQRKENLAAAKVLRYSAWKLSKEKMFQTASKIVVSSQTEVNFAE